MAINPSDSLRVPGPAAGRDESRLGAGAQEEVGVAIGGLVAQALREDVEVGLVFDQAVERVGPDGELHAARLLVVVCGEAVGDALLPRRRPASRRRACRRRSGPWPRGQRPSRQR